MRKIIHVVVVTSLAATVLASGCRRGPYVWVQQKKYKPRLPAYLSKAYRGRAIHLKPFVNQTSSRYYYYSPDGSITYEGSPSLGGYARDCFRKALIRFMGMRVPNKASPSVPSLQVTLLRWTGRRIDAAVTLYRGRQPVLKRRYAVTNPPPPSTAKQHLLASSYYQMNLLITRIFMDRAFFMAYYRQAGGAATYQGPAAQPPGGKSDQPGPGPAPGPGEGPAPGTPPGAAPGTPPGTAPGTPPPPAPGHEGSEGDSPAVPQPEPEEGSTPSVH